MFHIFHSWEYLEVENRTFRICKKCQKVQEYHGAPGDIWYTNCKGREESLVKTAFILHEKTGCFKPSWEVHALNEIVKLEETIQRAKEKLENK